MLSALNRIVSNLVLLGFSMVYFTTALVARAIA